MTLLGRALVARGYGVHVFTRPPLVQSHRYVRWLREARIPITVLHRPQNIPGIPIVTSLVALMLVVPYMLVRGRGARQAWNACMSIVSTGVARVERAWLRARLDNALPKAPGIGILHLWGPAALTPVLLEWAESRTVASIYHEMGEADESYVAAWSLDGTIRALAKARAVLCCSESVAVSVRSVYRYRGPITAVPFMIADPTKTEPHRSNGVSLRFGTIGRLVPHKRHGDLIAAVRALVDAGADVKLVIAGDGPARDDLRALCRAIDVADRVEFLGPFENLADVMARFDVFALTSASESQCMPITESMAYGKPSVVSAVGGMPDFVEDGVTGFVVPLGDHDALVAALRRFVDEPALVEQMGEVARQRYLQRYHPGGVVSAIENVYRAVS